MSIPWYTWFARPMWLLALVILPLLGGLALYERKRRRTALALLGGGPAFSDSLTHGRRGGAELFLLMTLGLASLVVGMAGPQWGRDWTQSTARGRDLVVVLDMSRSMQAETPDRLQRAQLAILDLAKRVKEGGGDRLGLVIFAGHARLACPLTHEYSYFEDAVKEFDKDHLDPALYPDDDDVSGTRIGEALKLAVAAHEKEAHGMQDILLLSDGDDPADDEEWRKGIAAAQTREIPIHTVGVGDPNKDNTIDYAEEKVPTRLREQPLKDIAHATGGTYIPLQTKDYPLGELYLGLVAGSAAIEHGVDALPVYQQRAVWFLVPAFVLLAGATLIGDGRRRLYT
jgi:Ca-activated chloride channel family protein